MFSDERIFVAAPSDLREEALRFLMRSIGSEDMALQPVVQMPSKAPQEPVAPIFLVPGIEGV